MRYLDGRHGGRRGQAMLRRLVLVCVVGLLPQLSAARTVVCTAGDTGCILTAIAQSNLRPEPADVIELDASTFTLDRQDNGDQVNGFTGTPVILGNLTLRGAGGAQTILERSPDPDTPLFRLLHIGPSGRV